MKKANYTYHDEDKVIKTENGYIFIFSTIVEKDTKNGKKITSDAVIYRCAFSNEELKLLKFDINKDTFSQKDKQFLISHCKYGSAFEISAFVAYRLEFNMFTRELENNERYSSKVLLNGKDISKSFNAFEAYYDNTVPQVIKVLNSELDPTFSKARMVMEKITQMETKHVGKTIETVNSTETINVLNRS